MTDDVLTTKQLAERLGLSVCTVRDYAKAGVIPGLFVGSWRFYWPAVVEALSSSMKGEKAS